MIFRSDYAVFKLLTVFYHNPPKQSKAWNGLFDWKSHVFSNNNRSATNIFWISTYNFRVRRFLPVSSVLPVSFCSWNQKCVKIPRRINNTVFRAFWHTLVSQKQKSGARCRLQSASILPQSCNLLSESCTTLTESCTRLSKSWRSLASCKDVIQWV